MDYLYALQCCREMSPEFINLVFVFVSEVLLKLAMVYAAIIYWCFNKSDGATILLGYTSTYQLNQVIKNTACVYRPWIKDSRLHVAKLAQKSATGYSFPSGHTIGAGSLYGGIAVTYKKRIWVVALMSFLILLTAFSRNWLGAHTMQDVLVAIIEAAVMIILMNVIKLYLYNHPEKDTYFMIGGVVVAIAIILFLQFKKYPLDYDESGKLLVDPYYMLSDCYTALGMFTGSLTGWWLERHFVKFETEVSAKEKVLRAVVGAAVFGLLYLGLSFILSKMDKNLSHLIKFFILFFVIMYLYPLAFNAVSKKKKTVEVQ